MGAIRRAYTTVRTHRMLSIGNRMTTATRLAALVLPLAALLGGCAAPEPAPTSRTRLDAPTAASTPLASGEPARGSTPTVALLLDGEPVTWGTLRPLLAEAGGESVVEELALEHALRRELRARGLSIGEAETDAARETWLALLAESGVGAEAEREVRRRRGLGEQRFRRLLWRNAALRALVDPDAIAVSETEIGLARSVRTERRYLTSGVIARDASAALAIAQAARSSPGGPLAGLWGEASRRDLRPFQSVVSPFDPGFPESIRRALPSLPRGEPSAAIAVERGYAVVIVDAVLEGTGRTPGEAALRRELTIRKTRVAMERLARELVSRTEISRLDASLP
jgi:hypothetical protein